MSVAQLRESFIERKAARCRLNTLNPFVRSARDGVKPVYRADRRERERKDRDDEEAKGVSRETVRRRAFRKRRSRGKRFPIESSYAKRKRTVRILRGAPVLGVATSGKLKSTVAISNVFFFRIILLTIPSRSLTIVFQRDPRLSMLSRG